MPSMAPKHSPAKVSAKVHRNAKERDARQGKRQFATNSRMWRAIRAEQLQFEPLCRECSKSCKITPATDVDHIDGDSWNNRPSNLQSLCHSCHSAKTVRENGGFGFEQRRNDAK